MTQYTLSVNGSADDVEQSMGSKACAGRVEARPFQGEPDA